MAIRELKIQRASFKHRAVKIDGIWVDVAKNIDLRLFRLEQSYTVEITDKLPSGYLIHRIVSDTEGGKS